MMKYIGPLIITLSLVSLNLFASPESDGHLSLPIMTSTLLEKFITEQIDECKEHFDLRPFIKMASYDMENITNEEALFLMKAQQTLYTEGYLSIPEDSVDIAKTKQCADRAQGILLGSLKLAPLMNKIGRNR